MGYTFDFYNLTDTTLILALKKRGIQTKTYQIVAPGKQINQVWRDLNCLESVQWAKHDPTLKYNGGLSLVGTDQHISDINQKTFNKELVTEYAWNTITFKMISGTVFDEATQQDHLSTELKNKIEAAIDTSPLNLCNNQKFIIIDSGKKNMLTRQAELIAYAKSSQ